MKHFIFRDGIAGNVQNVKPVQIAQVSYFVHFFRCIYMNSLPVVFYRVHTLEGVWGTPSRMGPGVKPCGRKWFLGHFKRLQRVLKTRK